MVAVHRFDTVRDFEVRLASKLVKDAYPASANVHFVQIDKVDPPKKSMIKYLQAEQEGLKVPEIPRVLYCYYYTNTWTSTRLWLMLLLATSSPRPPYQRVLPVLSYHMT